MRTFHSLLIIGVFLVVFIITSWFYKIIEVVLPLKLGLIEIFYMVSIPCALIGTYATVYRWVWLPHQTKKMKRIESIYVPLKNILSKISIGVEVWEEFSKFDIDLGIEELPKFIENPETPRILKANLKDIKQFVCHYDEWLSEANDIISYAIKSKVNDTLHKYWNLFNMNRTLDAFLKECTTVLILDEKLSLQSVQNIAFASYGRDAKPVKESEEIKKLKDVFESESFCRLIDSLKKLENRPVIVTIRKSRKDLLNKIGKTIKWISEQMK